MELTKSTNSIGNHGKLKQVQNLVKAHYEGKLHSSLTVSTKGLPIVRVSALPSSTTAASCTLSYTPTFYMIGTLEENRLLTMRLITFHGQILVTKVGYQVD